MARTKEWFHSKTVWSGILKALGGLMFLLANTLVGELAISEAVVSGASIVWGAVDILIRFKTTQKLA